MISATQSVPVNVYLADLALQFGNAAFVIQAAQVYEFTPISGSPFQMLLGMDIIRQGSLSLTFDGHFTFCL